MNAYNSAETMIALIEAAHILSVFKVNVERGDTIESDVDVLDRSIATMKRMQAEELAKMQSAAGAIPAA